ncbi:hypothetical protein [Burkholderia vietnamiensis]|uniref:hypothetical protein n=1 Tax=Burkholderia vietnamiensis TaxID=60552 RepID=UPI0007569722|nr:hypothetical protein [Burkholderia vietnamiensis]KVE95922.1 hypothetical protein WJ03_00270 [Burkholderia vietnamiensis]
MNKRGLAVWLGGAALVASGSAMAGHVDLSVGIGVPVAPVYVAPQPAVVAYPGYGYGDYGDDDDDGYRKWRKHYYKHWRKHHDDDDD